MNTASRVMFIAGGTGSIGTEIAAQAVANGWRVVVHGRSQSSVNTCLSIVKSRYLQAEITAITADISPPTAITRLVESAANVYQRIDAVIDCVAAGPKEGGIAGEFSATDPQAYLSFMELSVVYFQQLTHAVLPWLKKTEGTLVALVSDAAIYPAAQQSLIGAARSATVGFIRNLAAEVARDAVRAHCVSPSFVLETNSADKLLALNPARLEKARQRAGLGLPTAVDIAPLVLFLCGSGARYITGQVISINGGLNT